MSVGIAWRSGLGGRDILCPGKNSLAISRRWTFLRTAKGNMFAGLGGAYKSETDHVNGTRLNFAEHVGWRFTRYEVGPGFELVVRHVSNAGLKKPNRGEDFITLDYVF
jgi:Lipid A 3-O-deacylase (PagL)